MSFNIQSPFMGLHYDIEVIKDIAVINVNQFEGDILPPLVKMELVLAEQGIKSIHLNANGISLDQKRLERIHYYWQQKDEGLGFWEKSVTYQKTVRFSITEKCNYHCFFCHEEGMEMTVKRDSADTERFFEIIKQLADLDYQDFTFTGGEPLLNWRGIEACLTYMENINYLPEITIVTNGERLNQRMLDRLNAYPGKVRFNLSLHSLIDEDYLDIVHKIKKPEINKIELLDNIKKKMGLISQENIPFKLNVVLLRGLNTSPEALHEILSYAQKCGAKAVKFLELLITEPLQKYYPYFYLITTNPQLLPTILKMWQAERWISWPRIECSFKKAYQFISLFPFMAPKNNANNDCFRCAGQWDTDALNATMISIAS